MPWSRRIRRPPPLQSATRPDVYPAGGFSVATASLTDTFRPGVTGPGDLLILFAGDASSNAINAVSVNDTQGNVWRKGPAVASGGSNLPTSAWCCARSRALDPRADTVTVTWDTATSFGKSVSLTGVNAAIVPNPDVDYVASASATGASAAPSVTSGTPAYAGEFAVGCINNGFSGNLPVPTGANTPAGPFQHNDATNWVLPTYAPLQGAGAVSVTASLGASVSWSALVIMVAPNLQVAPVYPQHGPVRAQVPAVPRTGAGQASSRAGPYRQPGPAVTPLQGPVRARLPGPFRPGRFASRRGAYGQQGPPARIWSGPVRGQPAVPVLTGRSQHRGGVRGVLGPVLRPLTSPVRAAWPAAARFARTAARAGVQGVLGPAVRVWHSPVLAKLPPGRPPGRALGRAGTFTAPAPQAGPPVYPAGHPVQARQLSGPPRGRAAGRAGTYRQTGPPARPLTGPVRGRVPGPYLAGRSRTTRLPVTAAPAVPSIGTLTASDQAGTLTTSTGAASTLAASTVPVGVLTAVMDAAGFDTFTDVFHDIFGDPPSGTLTATDTRTGGPG